MSIAEELARIAGKVDEVDRGHRRTLVKQRRARGQARGRATRMAAAAVARHDAADHTARFSELADDDLVYIETVVAICGVSQANMHRSVAKYGFPPPVGERKGASSPRQLWRVGDVRAWLKANRP